MGSQVAKDNKGSKLSSIDFTLWTQAGTIVLSALPLPAWGRQ